MNEKVTAILSRTTADTFEQLAFLFSFTADETDTMPASDMIEVGVNFSGPFSGTLHLKMTEDVLTELTINMLGMDDDEESTPEDRADAFRESVNVVCGNLLPLIGGKEAVFDITSPQIIESGKDAPLVLGEQVARALLEVDDGFCEVSLYVDGELPEIPE